MATPNLNLARLSKAPTAVEDIALEIPRLPELELSPRFREHYREQASMIDDYNAAMGRWVDQLTSLFEGIEVKPGTTKES